MTGPDPGQQAAGHHRGGSLHDILVDRRLVTALFSRGLITTEARDHALDMIEPPRQWGVWSGRLLLVTGIALVLAGIVNFFAFNWQAIPGLAKLAGIATLLALSGGGAAVAGPDRLAGRALITVAVALTGVFLAVFGQVYQTGADAWQLFAGWALLALPWTLLSLTAATWAIWLAVSNLALHLWIQQTFPRAPDLVGLETLALVSFTGAFLIAREVMAARGVRWVADRWTRDYLLLPILGLAVLCLIGIIVDRHSRQAPGTAGAAVSAVAILGALVVYRRALPDLAALAAALIAGLVVAVMVVFQMLTSGSSRNDLGAFLITGLATILMFGLAAAWLRATARAMSAETIRRQETTDHG